MIVWSEEAVSVGTGAGFVGTGTPGLKATYQTEERSTDEDDEDGHEKLRGSS